MEASEFQVCDADLSETILSRYLEAGAISVDTETMGLNPYRDRLCLIQLCDPEGLITAVRILQGQREAPNLKALLEAKGTLKIFHFARFDMAMLRHHLGIQVNPVFCTKIASKLARTYSPKHGLKDVVLELQRIELDKSAQSSDWGNVVNLSPEQLRYAANDVRYLIGVQQHLLDMLKREDRWQLAQECFQFLPTQVSLDLLQFKDIFEH